ncbi:MAG: hypothetical protein K9M36_00805 [Candidatus Pacebacteria bacterium]|nr:hypothetical protein [Candidatus Paceibacterota bacterium]
MQLPAGEKDIEYIQSAKKDFYQKFSNLLIAKNSILRLFREKIETEKIREIQNDIKNH